MQSSGEHRRENADSHPLRYLKIESGSVERSETHHSRRLLQSRWVSLRSAHPTRLHRHARAGGASSIRQHLNLSAGAPGRLDRPVKPDDDSGELFDS